MRFSPISQSRFVTKSCDRGVSLQTFRLEPRESCSRFPPFQYIISVCFLNARCRLTVALRQQEQPNPTIPGDTNDPWHRTNHRSLPDTCLLCSNFDPRRSAVGVQIFRVTRRSIFVERPENICRALRSRPKRLDTVNHITDKIIGQSIGTLVLYTHHPNAERSREADLNVSATCFIACKGVLRHSANM